MRVSVSTLVLTTLGCLAASAASLALAPALMPESYSWVSHTTSDSAAQGVDGAWLARLGFLFFGLGVLALGRISSASWGRMAAASHATFGISMIATAAFSSRSWEPGVPFDQTEDLLHSAAATLMAVAFSVGVLAMAIRRAREGLPARPLDLLAIVASVFTRSEWRSGAIAPEPCSARCSLFCTPGTLRRR